MNDQQVKKLIENSIQKRYHKQADELTDTLMERDKILYNQIGPIVMALTALVNLLEDEGIMTHEAFQNYQLKAQLAMENRKLKSFDIEGVTP